MELVEGATLAERIRQGPIALEEALPLARQIAEALDAAHAKGIVHRDCRESSFASHGPSLGAPSNDLKRFLLTVPVQQQTSEFFTVMLNWSSGLNAR